MNKQRSNPTNNDVQLAESYKYYGLNKKEKAQAQKIPNWMEQVITNKKERVNVKKYEGIWP